MNAYANKTCNQCGVIKPQPEMHQRKIAVKTGKSTSGFTWSNYLGVVIGDQPAKRKFRQSLWSNNKRNYTRYKQVWLCDKCVEDHLGPFGTFCAKVIDIVFYIGLIYVSIKILGWFLS
jgi:hypothetical protein